MAFLKFRPLTSRYNFRSTLNLERLNISELNVGIERYIMEDEEIKMIFKSGRDLGIFTNRRILLIDVKGIRGLRKSIFSLKYDSISSYELDIHTFDSAINIISDSGYRTSLNFLKPIPLEDMFMVYHLIDNYSLVGSKQ